ncbi:MAG: basic amino acid ABC transporter substrate-binding protein [Eubacterium sp.]|nr:basic amino acid ABC transporter substrate-binding protein [Eubacterium sp.]MCM1302658.1 basic amino acid ABC transporter substrate-binding protein [Butyrivibrio sp.]MCM1342213.1 basic amino acid ABC transporter substrate-binding protein [Muribaculaceae bacterium]MCM1409212.1 basic amino acid ABC transporter substrate-binding protein [Lachnospiraceae bacterium]
MKKLLAMLTAAVLCVAALAACGSDEASASAGSQAAGDRPVLVVGTNAEFPPFEYVGDNGEPDGFDVALIGAIADKMGMDVQMENIEFDSLVASIGTKLDAAIAGMSITEERLAEVDFSDEYYEAVQYVVVPAGSDIAAPEDLEGKTIGVQLGTTGNFIADEIKDANVQTYNKAVDAVTDLTNGRVDVVIIDKNPAEVFAEQFSGKVEIIDGAQFEFEPEYYAIALPKGSDMVEKVNAALAELKADGTFDALVEQYIQ